MIAGIFRSYWLDSVNIYVEYFQPRPRRKAVSQLELEVVAENAAAVRLYEAAGFREYGRNPRGFLSRRGWQELVLMRLELDR